jgi:hypothetical protein
MVAIQRLLASPRVTHEEKEAFQHACRVLQTEEDAPRESGIAARYAALGQLLRLEQQLLLQGHEDEPAADDVAHVTADLFRRLHTQEQLRACCASSLTQVRRGCSLLLDRLRRALLAVA